MKNTFVKVLSFFVTYSISLITSLGLGNYYEYGILGLVVGQILVFSTFYLCKNITLLKKVAFFWVVVSLYFPAGMLYGYPRDEILFSILQTNGMEVIGFLESALMEYSILLLYLLLMIILIFIKRKELCNGAGDIGRKQYLVILFIILSFCFEIPGYGKDTGKSFFATFITTVHNVINLNTEVNFSKLSDVKLTSNDDDLKILVIGESVRADYMSCFGYPLKTTPFLDSANGLFFDNYISPSWNTRLSLRFMLFDRKDEDPTSISNERNIITLAKASGYEVSWISNQGRSGWGDEIIYNLAGIADNRNFIKKQIIMMKIKMILV